MAGRAASSARLGQRFFLGKGLLGFFEGEFAEKESFGYFCKKLVCYDEEGFYLFDEQG